MSYIFVEIRKSEMSSCLVAGAKSLKTCQGEVRTKMRKDVDEYVRCCAKGAVYRLTEVWRAVKMNKEE